ncbi:hypothetical protein KOR42_41390 [Thalassoglobus neptunius]|uniref:ABC-2 family transporter protein n=1 Tax=Thalassoglobus neptunius TaxID=1938619 RepID=A0A5C5WAV2_9PLAN|nr:hypothetical protein [Thalassoglobus neptunius]TWT47141.1 hypothetical protein KOR42_41390 [Thalassoglobus neptunius]
MSIWSTLLWKEWNEHKWKLLSLTVIAIAVCIGGLVDGVSEVEFAVIATYYGYVLFAPIYIVMGVTAGEWAGGTIEFSKNLPVSLRKVATVRLFAGWIVLIVPVIAVAAFSSALIATLEWMEIEVGIFHSLAASMDLKPQQAHWGIAGIACGVVTTLYFWLVVACLNQATELRAAMIGVLTFIVSFWFGFLLWVMNGAPTTQALSLNWTIGAVSPVYWMVLPNLQAEHLRRWLIVGLQVQGLFVVISSYYFIRFYGTHLRQWNWLPRISWPSIEQTGPTNSLSAPFTSQMKALVWMQLRQTLPLAIGGLVIVFVLTLMATRGTAGAVSQMETNPFQIAIVSVAALLIGSTTFVPDFSPKLYHFWRSRPIPPMRWFWLKYLSGLFVIICCVDLPILILHGTGILPTSAGLYSGVFPMLLHWIIYSIAVLAACLVRHPIYSPVLALCAILTVLLLPVIFHFPDFLSFGEMFNAVGTNLLPNRVIAAFLVGLTQATAISVTATILAAIATKRDINLSP